ncbi:unnamed protein product [Prunus armeniaca]
MLAAITFNVATSLEPCAKYGQPHMGVKSAQELIKMNKSQAFHQETIPKHVLGSWSSWQVWAAGAVGKCGQLEQVACMGKREQLGAAKRGVLHQPKGRMKFLSINRELLTHSREREADTHIHFIHYSHTHIQIHYKERRELGAVLGIPCCHHLLLRIESTSSHHTMMFPKFWTQSDIYWSMKSDNSGSYVVSSEMEWLVYFRVLAIGFPQNPPNDSSHHVMMFPKFWTQFDSDLSMKSDNSDSWEVRSEMEWFMYCILLAIGFHSKPTK